MFSVFLVCSSPTPVIMQHMDDLDSCRVSPANNACLEMIGMISENEGGHSFFNATHTINLQLFVLIIINKNLTYLILNELPHEQERLMFGFTN